MTPNSFAILIATLRIYAPLSKSRLETLLLLVTGLLGARSVNLSHVASEWRTSAKISSTYRRLQRFFQHVRLGEDWSARLTVNLLNLSGPWSLGLDRTNWKVGSKDINILVLAIITHRHRVPLMWTLLPGPGNSNTTHRIALMKRYLAIFGSGSIKTLLADREFIGFKWLKFLDDHDVPFAIRLRSNQIVLCEDGSRMALKELLRTCRGERKLRIGYLASKAEDPIWLGCAAKRIKGGELLIVVANRNAHRALSAYRKRWGIECVFSDAKTRGLNLEDTRLISHRKLSILLAVVAIAMAWASRTASIVLGRKPIPRKSHGYPAKSRFRIGFDHLRKLLRYDPDKAAGIWKLAKTKHLRKLRVV